MLFKGYPSSTILVNGINKNILSNRRITKTTKIKVIRKRMQKRKKSLTQAHEEDTMKFYKL